MTLGQSCKQSFCGELRTTGRATGWCGQTDTVQWFLTARWGGDDGLMLTACPRAPGALASVFAWRPSSQWPRGADRWHPPGWRADACEEFRAARRVLTFSVFVTNYFWVLCLVMYWRLPTNVTAISRLPIALFTFIRKEHVWTPLQYEICGQFSLLCSAGRRNHHSNRVTTVRTLELCLQLL